MFQDVRVFQGVLGCFGFFLRFEAFRGFEGSLGLSGFLRGFRVCRRYMVHGSGFRAQAQGLDSGGFWDLGCVAYSV